MRLYLDGAPTLEEIPYCPECSFERAFGEDATCRNCRYNCGPEFAQHLQTYIEELDPPEGVEIVASWHQLPSPWKSKAHVDMRVDKCASPALVIKWLDEVGAEIRLPAARFLGLLCHINEELIEVSRMSLQAQMGDEIDELLTWIRGTIKPT